MFLKVRCCLWLFFMPKDTVREFCLKDPTSCVCVLVCCPVQIFRPDTSEFCLCIEKYKQFWPREEGKEKIIRILFFTETIVRQGALISAGKFAGELYWLLFS